MPLSTQDIIEQTAEFTMKTYAFQPAILSHGKGSYAFDTDGNQYLDFAIGIAVASLGHAHPKMIAAINDQVSKMIACQASYTNETRLKATKLLIDNGCFDEVFFTNSGTESVECALKLARKWVYDNKSKDAHEIIAFRNSFHGRSMGAASVTEKALSQPYYAPYVPGVHFAQFNDLESVKVLINDKTAAIIVEPVQGEGGLNPATPQFLRGLRALCDAHKIVLIFDEVQCGSGRLGTFYAYQSFECCPDCHDNGGVVVESNAAPVEPDIACLAKGMGGGFPVGACVAKKEFAQVFVPGTHGTTYGGNPLACAVVACVLGEFASKGFLEHTRAMADLFNQELVVLQGRSNKLRRITGKGLMVGIETEVPIKEMISKLRQNGLMATQAGADLVRLTPPLNVSAEEIREAVAIIERTLKEDF
jgi:predicted acetylornithine/succinylornithine family transaminase